MPNPTPAPPPAPAAAPAAADHHAALYAGFRWHVPERLNIAEVCCRRWARDGSHAARVAVRWENEDGLAGVLTYGQLQQQSDRLSNVLVALGVQLGDRVAIVMPQRAETAVAYLAVLQAGAVATPLSMLFGPEALEYRLRDSGAVVALVDAAATAAVRSVRAACPALRHLVLLGGAPADDTTESAWHARMAVAALHYAAHETRADDPAVLIYTSGTTGPPKGALIPHRALVGNLSGFVCSQNWFGMPGPGVANHERPAPAARRSAAAVAPDEVFWSPADWTWTGGLMDALLPTLFFGREIVACHGRFDPERAYAVLERHRVTHAFLFPTALKAMMKAVPAPRERYRLRLRALMSAGEPVGDAVFAWCREALGIVVNEMYGQTEVNYVVGNCGSFVDARGNRHPGWPARPGSMGRPYPGHRVAVIDENGRECPRGTPGEIAVHRRDVHGELDPVFFLGYWHNEEATRHKFTGDALDSWCRTGDTAVMDADGYLWYQGRADDVFKSAGYRIGPSEVENCLVKHPAVANAAVVPKPDAARGALVKAYVVLAPGHTASDALVAELQAHVRGRLAPYEYPKEIEFIDALPMTTTGKVQRRVLRERELDRARQGEGSRSGSPGRDRSHSGGPPRRAAGGKGRS